MYSVYRVVPIVAACAFYSIPSATTVTAHPLILGIGHKVLGKSPEVRVAYLPSQEAAIYPPSTAYAMDPFPPSAAYLGPFTNYLYNRYANWNLYAPFIQEASQRFGIPASWIEAVIRFESRGNVYAVSPAGAIGLMQLLPSTWEILRARYALGYTPFDPHDNIIAGTAYLRELFDRYGSPGFLISYNAGPARWEAYLRTGQLLPASAGQMVDALRPYLEGARM